MENIKQALLKAKEVIDYHLSELGEDTSEAAIKSIECFIAGINVGCECDDYNGYSCGCNARSRIIKLALEDIEILSSR